MAEPVARIRADFNARLEDGRVNLGTKGAWADVRAHVKEHRQRVVLTDGEVEVDAEILIDTQVPGGTTAKLLGEFRDVPKGQP